MEFSLADLPKVARDIVERAQKNASDRELSQMNHATLITFSGDLGAGKTTLIQQIARTLGIRETLQSPTFVIYKRYRVLDTLPIFDERRPAHLFKRFIHGDMYRLESAEEIKKLGWEELLADPRNLICIEWPEKVAEAIPDWAIKVTLGHKEGGEKRGIDITG